MFFEHNKILLRFYLYFKRRYVGRFSLLTVSGALHHPPNIVLNRIARKCNVGFENGVRFYFLKLLQASSTFVKSITIFPTGNSASVVLHFFSYKFIAVFSIFSRLALQKLYSASISIL